MYNICRHGGWGHVHVYVYLHRPTSSEQSCDQVVILYGQNLGILNNLSVNLGFVSKVQRDKED